ncbi:MAG: hypothetical protein ACT4P6_16455 [Gemmatimonadaceae bacterium]
MRRECPHSWVGDPTDSLHRALEDAVDLVRPIINVPEFHDCQRFIAVEDNRSRYLEFYAILASWRIDSLLSDLQVQQLPAPAILTPAIGPAGGLPTITQPPPPAGQPAASPVAVPIAEIYAEGRYPALGIEPWLNCLYIFIQNGRWEAAMVPKGGVNVRCPSVALTSERLGTMLEVRATSPAGFSAERDYPAVARWDWDSVNTQQYIGVKCGAAWCEIGRKGFRASSPLPVLSTDPAEVRRVRLIKGWYDQQLLAKGDPKDRSRLVPSGILGTIVPDPKLGDHNDPGDFIGHVVPVATVSLAPSGAVDAAAMLEYARKFNFARATVTAPNVVTLCNDATGAPSGTCVNIWSALNGNPIPPIAAAAAAASCGWWAIVKRADGSAPSHAARCVRRFDAPTTLTGPGIPAGHRLTIPGTVRWRWMARDEGNWYRCLNGCCEMTE